MKRLLAVALGAASISVASAAWADWSVGGGMESFRWEESTTPAVEESGLRFTLELNWQQTKQPGLSAEYQLKFYRGDVDYTGATLFGGTPLSGESRYRGWSNEVRAVWRSQSPVDFVMALGYDQWERRFPQTAQEEDYNVIYARLGVAFNSVAKVGVLGSLGAKYPLWTRENAHFESIGAITNPRLRPGKDVSFYGTIGYRFNPNWDVLAYYDSYRFKESNVVAVVFPAGTAGFFQPKSDMDVFGLTIKYNFQ